MQKRNKEIRSGYTNGGINATSVTGLSNAKSISEKSWTNSRTRMTSGRILCDTLNSTIQELRLCRQAISGILSEKENAVAFINQWFWNQLYPQKSLRKEQCMVAGGCCERKCGCCYKPRQTKDGKTTKHYDELKQSYNNYAHCTEDCGCCLRYWESRWTS